MFGPMEIERIQFTGWRWTRLADIPLESYTFGVDALYRSTRFHWFLKKTVEFELRGPRVSIMQFIEKKLGDGSCLRIKMGKSLQRRLQKANH